MTDVLQATSLGFPSPRVLTETVRQWAPDPNQFKFAALMPLADYPFEIVAWDEEDAVTGMTHAYTQDANPLLVKPVGRKERYARTTYWRETLKLKESDILRARAVGRYDQKAGRDIAMGLTRQGAIRLDTRIEWLRAQVLTTGKLNIDEDGITREIDYGVDSGNKPTASNLWSNAVTSDPIGDLSTWLQLFRGAASGGRIFANVKTAINLSKNEGLMALFAQSPMVGNLGVRNVGDLITNHAALDVPVTFEVYDGGYTADDGVTFTPFIPDGKLVIIANPPYGQDLGKFYTTPSLSNGGGMDGRPGKTLVVDDKLMTAKPRYEQTHGIYGIPVLRFPRAIIIATVS